MNSTICYPADTDWGCAYTAEQLEDMRAKPEVLVTMQRSEALAWSTLAALTGYQIGVCPITVRPCLAGCRGGAAVSPALPTPYSIGAFRPHINSAGVWVNSCGCDSGDCSCSQLCEAILPGPVGAVTEVLLDGAVLDPTAYRIDNGTRLVRTDGGCWPTCQDMAKPTTEVGTFAVSYYRGAAPNELTAYAAGVLATEFFKACSGDSCRLPSGVTSVTRQGVSFQIPTGLFRNGMTGIREVDAVIGTYNPNGLKAGPVVTSPDMRPARMTTWG